MVKYDYFLLFLISIDLDKQNCTLEIQSWSRPSDELLVRHQPQNARQQNQYIRTEWQVYYIEVRNQTKKRYLWLVFDINMKRNYQFYVNHMIFPFSILSCLTLFVFWLPPDSGEKITLTITILLALTVFLQLISEYTPKASSNLPIIGKYPGASILSDLIGSDDPTKSYRIPGDGFRQANLSNVPNFTSSRFSYTREHHF